MKTEKIKHPVIHWIILVILIGVTILTKDAPIFAVIVGVIAFFHYTMNIHWHYKGAPTRPVNMDDTSHLFENNTKGNVGLDRTSIDLGLQTQRNADD